MQWFGLIVTVAVLGGVAIMIAYAEPERPVCISQEHLVDAREIMLHALDNALEEHVKGLFLTWMRDATGQPGRAATGVRKALTAYDHAKRVAEELNLPVCPGR